MKRVSLTLSLVAVCVMQNTSVAFADTAAPLVSTAPSVSTAPPSATASSESTAGASDKEPVANSNDFPKQILRTGINLTSSGVSPNSAQLADDINLTPLLERMQTLRQKIDGMPPSAERSDARLDMMEARAQAFQIIDKTNLEIDFTIAEMRAEQDVYNEILSTFTSDRDKTLARVNAASFVSNGVLWAVCEGLAIPTHTRGVYAVSSGITGILAGLIPSFASMYTLKAVNGKKKTSEVEPNMLAKLFNYPTNSDIEYPRSVWLYLNQSPPDAKKSRKDIIVDRWISDSNIPNFTKRDSSKQLDVITASVAQKKGLSIATLSTRQTMIEQLSSEILKMKRLLLELAMVVQGDKQFVALRPAPGTTPVSSKPPMPSTTMGKGYSSDAVGNLTSQAFQNLLVP